MSRSYPNFGCVKTLTIPMEQSFLSAHDGDFFEEFASAFKERYGIDLHDIIKLTDNSIFLEYNGLVLLKVCNESDGHFPVGHTIPYFRSNLDKSWGSGTSDGKLHILISDLIADSSAYGFDIFISKSVDFDLENAEVYYIEI